MQRRIKLGILKKNRDPHCKVYEGGISTTTSTTADMYYDFHE
jgi:hypothetical protein